MAHGSGRWCAHSADEGPVHGQAAAMAEVAFRRVRPGEAVPPPPPELVKWGNDTLLATLLGMGYGASLAYRARELPTGEVSQQVSARLRLLHASALTTSCASQLAVQRNMVLLARATAGWGFKARGRRGRRQHEQA